MKSLFPSHVARLHPSAPALFPNVVIWLLTISAFFGALLRSNRFSPSRHGTRAVRRSLENQSLLDFGRLICCAIFTSNVFRSIFDPALSSALKSLAKGPSVVIRPAMIFLVVVGSGP
jgi:hypothetical protein